MNLGRFHSGFVTFGISVVDRDISSVKFIQILIGVREIFDERETS